jgi:hypothetical protein
MDIELINSIKDVLYKDVALQYSQIKHQALYLQEETIKLHEEKEKFMLYVIEERKNLERERVELEKLKDSLNYLFN